MYNGSKRIITDGEGQGCMDVGTSPVTTGTMYFARHCPARTATNEVFAYSTTTHQIISNCSGADCPPTAAGQATGGAASGGTTTQAEGQFCITMMPPPPPPPPPPRSQSLAAASANDCIPWSIDPNNADGDGWYWDAGMDGMVLTANDTLISIHEAEKYRHQDDNNRIDLIIRRSFDQGRTWQPWQLLHTGSNATHQATIGQGTPVLDRHTGRLHMLMTRNNTFLLVTHTDVRSLSLWDLWIVTAVLSCPFSPSLSFCFFFLSPCFSFIRSLIRVLLTATVRSFGCAQDNGATWSPVKDITADSKPHNYGWIGYECHIKNACFISDSAVRILACTQCCTPRVLLYY
jgi:hypothetical protein